MKRFTIAELRRVFRIRYALTKERYTNYAVAMFGLTEEEACREYEILFNIQRAMIAEFGRSPSDKTIEQVISHSFSIEQVMIDKSHVNIPFELAHKTLFNKKIVYYSQPQDEELHQLKVNLDRSEDIICYAELLKRRCKIKVVLDYVETINTSHDWDNRQSEEEDIYTGDIISCMNDSGYDAGVYLCEGPQKGYSQLLYTKGKGYIRDGKPDRDRDHSYTSYKFNAHDKKFKKIGNIYLDASILIEGGTGV